MKALTLLLLSASLYADNYKIGSTWDRHSVASLNSKHPYRKLARGISRINSGTASYIGKHHGKHLLITNKHVCPKPLFCVGNLIDFKFTVNSDGKNLFAKVETILNTWDDIDLSLLEIRFINGNENVYEKIALKLDFESPLIRGNKLLLMGFGVHLNKKRELTFEAGNDCRVFSRDEEILRRRDPDKMNPLPYAVWSSLIGCDASHSDSGAPVFLTGSNKVFGIIWTGKTPKSKSIQNSEALREMGPEFLWGELNYIVPAKAIYPYIKNYLEFN